MDVNLPFYVPKCWRHKAQSLQKIDVYLENNGLVDCKDGLIFFVKVSLHPFHPLSPPILFKLKYLAPGVSILHVGIY